MQLAKLAVVCAPLVLALGCGGGGMGSSGGGSNPASESIVISKGTNGTFSVAMSRSFQPAEWDYQFFTLNPTATTTLGTLGTHHIRLQGVSQGVPQTTASTWDFSILDAITQPVLSVGDHSPEFQIAVAPAFMYDDTHFFRDQTYEQCAACAQDLVRYYNVPGGFGARWAARLTERD